MKKAIYIFLSVFTIASCQNKKSNTAAMVNTTLKVSNDTTLKVSNGSYPKCNYLENPTYIINKGYVVYQDCNIHTIIYPDPTSFRIPKYDEYGFALDKNGVYLRGELVQIDTTGFVAFGSNSKKEILWKTNKAVFKNLTEVKGIDAPTFTFLSRPYFKDKNFIYYFDQKIEGSDAASAIKTDYDGCQDKNHFYSEGKIATYKGDPLEYINIYLRKTKQTVFYQGKIMPEISAPTLVGLSRAYAKDKNHIYFDDQIVPILPEKFNKIRVWEEANCSFITDGKNIYCGIYKSDKEFDIATFGTLSDEHCYDKDGIYSRRYDTKLDKYIYEILPFIYTDNVSNTNTFEYRYVFYKNQAYEPDTKKLYENLTEKQIKLGRNKKLLLTNIEGPNELEQIYDYQFYKIGNHIYCQNKLTDIDGNAFQSIGKSSQYYKDHKDVYYYRGDKGLQKMDNVDVNSIKIFNSFLMDKNSLYIQGTKVLNSSDIELLAIFPGYRLGCGSDPSPSSNFYLFKNNEGFWLMKFSNVISYRFLGKIFDRNWDPAFAEIEIPKKYGIIPKVKIAIPEVKIAIPEDNQVYNSASVEVKPEYPGGLEKMYEFLGKNYVVPNEFAGETTCPGKIYVKFVVEKDGSLSDIKILRDIGYGTGKELIRILPLSPKWIPAELNGRKVRCSYNIPFSIPVKVN